MRLIVMTKSHIDNCARPSSGASMTKAPNVVATPLPPFNPLSIGNVCPTITVAAIQPQVAVSTPENMGIKTASPPLPISANNVRSAALRLPVRRTLVVPGLPEPLWRGSGKLNQLQINTALGMDPSK